MHRDYAEFVWVCLSPVNIVAGVDSDCFAGGQVLALRRGVVADHPRNAAAAAAKQSNTQIILSYPFIAHCLKFLNNFLIYFLLCSRDSRLTRQIDVDWVCRPVPAAAVASAATASRGDRQSRDMVHMMVLYPLISKIICISLGVTHDSKLLW